MQGPRPNAITAQPVFCDRPPPDNTTGSPHPGASQQGGGRDIEGSPYFFSYAGARGTPLPYPTTPAPDRAARPPAARLDVARLGPVVQDLFTAGLAASTRRAYQSGSDRYGKFCQGASLTPYPATEEGLLIFIAHLYEAKLAHGTIKSYLAAIRYEQIRRGWDNPQIHSMPRVEYVLKGVKSHPSELQASLTHHSRHTAGNEEGVASRG